MITHIFYAFNELGDVIKEGEVSIPEGDDRDSPSVISSIKATLKYYPKIVRWAWCTKLVK